MRFDWLIGIIQTVNNIVTSDNYSLVEYKRPFNWYKKLILKQNSLYTIAYVCPMSRWPELCIFDTNNREMRILH